VRLTFFGVRGSTPAVDDPVEVLALEIPHTGDKPFLGHATVEHGCKLAEKAVVGTLAPVHSALSRTDDEIKAMVEEIHLAAVEVEPAFEGMVLTL